MNISNLIGVLQAKRGRMTDAELARRLDQSPQNIYKKIKNNTWKIKELAEVASVLGCYVKIQFIDKGTDKVLAETDSKE